MRVCLFEDQTATLEPLTWTRPVFALRCGLTTLAEKQLRRFVPWSIGVLIRPHLANLVRTQHPDWTVNDLDWLRAETTVLVNGRWLPPAPPVGERPVLTGRFTPAARLEPCVALVGKEVAYAVVPRELLAGVAGGNPPLPPLGKEGQGDWLEHWKDSLPHEEAGGRLLCYPWELVEHNGRQIAADFPQLAAGRPRGPVPGLTVLGPVGDVLVDLSARIEPHVLADASHGPVVIDAEAVITAFTRLEGPCYIGPGTHVLGAKIRGCTLGPHCRIGGEVEASIIHGYANKYHDGFLGHSYLGEWINLGAGTHNSDLRNDYGPVTVTVNGQRVPTGRTKVGCFVGDHTKTGLGTLINTGSNIGVFCQLLPAGPLAPKYVPSFTSWWNGSLRESFEWHRLLATAQTVMHRRGWALTEAQETLYRHIFAETAAERRRALREAESRYFRKSA